MKISDELRAVSRGVELTCGRRESTKGPLLPSNARSNDTSPGFLFHAELENGCYERASTWAIKTQRGLFSRLDFETVMARGRKEQGAGKIVVKWTLTCFS